MTFSDSKIVKLINDRFEPAWEAVAPVRIVTFDLGEGRSLRGTVSGEIALYFCTPEGKVFDILPALQSPAATRRAMEEALAFYDSVDGKFTAKNIRDYHQNRAAEIEINHFVSGLESQESRLQKSINGIKKRENAINEAKDEATEDLRKMVFSKTRVATLVPLGSAESIMIVEPGGRGYFRWQVSRRFLSEEHWTKDNTNYDQRKSSDPILHIVPPLKTPTKWSKELFETILHQPLEGGEVTYDSDSLEAIRIIGE